MGKTAGQGRASPCAFGEFGGVRILQVGGQLLVWTVHYQVEVQELLPTLSTGKIKCPRTPVTDVYSSRGSGGLAKLVTRMAISRSSN